MEKLYYRIDFSLKSALAIGSGANDTTDKDIVRDGRGVPYIPGTTLAGIYRALFDKNKQEYYFGKIDGQNADTSKVIVYDATLKSMEFKIGKRDCVSLDEYKTAISGSKFDFEILEPGVEFVTYVEQDRFDEDADIIQTIANEWSNGNINIGGKTQRGLGQVCVKDIKRVSFDMSSDIDKWLEFDIYDDEKWQNIESVKDVLNDEKLVDTVCNECVYITLGLKQEGPISIRVYTTDISASDTNPDHKQLAYIRNETEIPVIPGTSWAGCFLHNMKKLGYKNEDEIFGSTKAKSKIYFSESEIIGAKAKIVTRNAIDRFTGGCVDNALFTEKMYYGGKTELTISIECKCTREFYEKLAISIVDLHMGFMAVGGETSVGHGLFEVESITINGQSLAICNDSMYESIMEVLENV
ncbi:MAG: hypothetical protein J6L69_07945 [Lachnospiraceae bacterium]|nr:hypothetical protein [Lachnospiraceae bacterium]